MKITGTICKDSPRYADWLKVFGSETIPLLSPLPQTAIGPDGVEREFYKMDLTALTDDQFVNLIAHLSEQFHMSPDEITYGLKQVGPPILADHVIVPIDTRFLV